ncbi:MAG: hypothetical protein Q8L27_02655 [archaeon]|nr:hypothetical protein [archaeon]
MSLTDYLIKHLGNEIKALRKIIQRTEKSLLVLDDCNLDEANYVVYLHSCWSNEGEKSITHSYRGSLKDAIKTAEEKFMKINNRRDVQAHYSVSIYLKKLPFDIPQNFWQNYKKR